MGTNLQQLDILERYLKQNNYYYIRKDKEPSHPGLDGYDELHQIRVYSDKICTQELWDVICHKGSYGSAHGLLETMGMIEDHGDVTGWLTAKDIIERLERNEANKVL